MITLADLHAAQARLQGITIRTQLIQFPLCADDPRHLLLKPENQQPIGAFKLRGAYNKIASLSEDERKRGVISYSSGNHAQGVAYAARALNTKSIIVMPNNAPAIKREATAALGAEIVLVGPGSDERKAKAEELAAEHGYIIVPPYNDEKIIAGQGTIGLEILEDLPDVEAVFAPVGGGGLISGVATAIKLSNPKVKVIGVEPELAADAQASLRSRKNCPVPRRAGLAHSGRRIAHPERRPHQLRAHPRLRRRHHHRHRRRNPPGDEVSERQSRHGGRTQRRRLRRRIYLPRHSTPPHEAERGHHQRRQYRAGDARGTAPRVGAYIVTFIRRSLKCSFLVK